MSKKVMIVDDEPNIVMSLEFLLRKKGHPVFIARNGAEAMALLENEVPDIIVLDIMMPDMDGYEICEYVKSQSQFDHTKVIFLSAKSKQSDIDKGYEVGADLYVTKPFSTRDLMKHIDNL